MGSEFDEVIWVQRHEGIGLFCQNFFRKRFERHFADQLIILTDLAAQSPENFKINYKTLGVLFVKTITPWSILVPLMGQTLIFGLVFALFFDSDKIFRKTKKNNRFIFFTTNSFPDEFSTYDPSFL